MAAPIGHVTYRYHDVPGCQVILAISAFSSGYRCQVEINGAPTRSARRKTLAAALRWGLDSADWQVDLLGFVPPQPLLELVYSEVEAKLAA